MRPALKEVEAETRETTTVMLYRVVRGYTPPESWYAEGRVKSHAGWNWAEVYPLSKITIPDDDQVTPEDLRAALVEAGQVHHRDKITDCTVVEAMLDSVVSSDGSEPEMVPYRHYIAFAYAGEFVFDF